MHTILRPLMLMLVLAAPGAFAHDYAKGSLHIEHPWSRATPKGASIGAGYLVIENRGSTVDRLLSISSEISGRVEMHEMAVTDGIMRMRPLPNGVEIAPGLTAKFEPGGLHLMFVGLKRPLEKGERFKAALVFEKAGPIEVEFVVEALGAADHRHTN